jgi:hypothetical protein
VDRAQVVDDLRPEDGQQVEGVRLANIRRMKLEAAGPRGAPQMRSAAGREIVDDEHLGPVVEQSVDQVMADEPGPTRHQHASRHGSSSATRLLSGCKRPVI